MLRAKGRPAADATAAQVRFESALALGDVWALDSLWHELGFSGLGAIFRRARFTTPLEHAIRVMVFNRLCDADSKLGVLRWLQTVSMPGIEVAKLTHQHLLRSMDALMDHQQDGDVRHLGMSKEGVIARQFMLGVVQTADGMPIYHEVFDGNTAEAPTLEPTLKKVLARYPHIRRLVVVADRGLLSIDNIEALSKLRVAGERPLEFILAVPGRRYGEFVDLLEPMSKRATQATDEIVEEAQWQGHRLVVVHNPRQACEQTHQRLARIHALQQRANQLAGKLDAQDEGKVRRGRKLSDSGAKARFFHEVSDAHLARIIKVDLQSELFTYTIDETALARAQLMDGKLMLLTNVQDMTPNEVLRRYKSLADIERGFKVLKSEIEIAPVFHRLPERIKAHASICFMALILYRIMRQRLKLAGSELSPETTLAELRRIQRHTVRIDSGAPIHGVSTVQPRQADLLAALNIKKPTHDPLLALL